MISAIFVPTYSLQSNQLYLPMALESIPLLSSTPCPCVLHPLVQDSATLSSGLFLQPLKLSLSSGLTPTLAGEIVLRHKSCFYHLKPLVIPGALSVQHKLTPIQCSPGQTDAFLSTHCFSILHKSKIELLLNAYLMVSQLSLKLYQAL